MPEYKLHSDLAQFCLPASGRDDTRRLAWVNSICVGFLAIGMIGIKSRPIEIKQAEVVTDVVPVIFTPPEPPPPTTPQQVNELPPEQPPETITDVPVVATVVAANPAEAAFPLPVEGPVVFAPANFAAAPPATLPKAAPPSPPKPVLFNAGAEKGTFPDPPYPAEALRRGAQGKVMLYVVVAEDGSLEKAEVLDGSGFSVLDSHSLRWVKSRWRFPAGQVRHYHIPFIYQIK